MKLTTLRIIRENCPDKVTCPTLARTDRKSYVIVGATVTDPEALGALGISDGETAVEVPASLLER